jgi:Domain of unknown function (DUF4386)
MSTSPSVTTKRIAGESPRQLARIAGVLYLINVIVGAFAIGYVPAAIVVPGDAAATARNILTHELLYRAGLVAHLIVLPTNIGLALIFYDLFKVVNRRLALLVVFFTLVGTAVEGANLVNQFTPLILLTSGRSSGGLTAEQIQTLASTPLALQAVGYDVQQVIYTGYLLAAGYLIVRSAFLPRILGVLLAIGALCYLTYSLADLLSPEFATRLVPYIQAPSGVAELSLCVWLLAVGVNDQRWKEQASAAAVEVNG